jgi:hypothetical protein
MADNLQQEEVSNETQQTKPQAVPYEAYESLYKQAIELEARYKKLFELYNKLLEAYLAQK